MRMTPGRGRGHLCWGPLIFNVQLANAYKPVSASGARRLGIGEGFRGVVVGQTAIRPMLRGTAIQHLPGSVQRKSKSQIREFQSKIKYIEISIVCRNSEINHQYSLFR